MEAFPKITVDDISPRQKRVLVAEDNVALRDYLVAVLRAEGYEVVEASTAEDLVDCLAISLHPELGCGAFDLVVAEDRLVHRGEASLERGGWARARMPPFVLIGTTPRISQGQHPLAAKAVARLEKPLDMEDLCSAVRCIARPTASAQESEVQASN